MHTNLPGHYDFNCYAKCNMNISLADLEGFKPAGAFALQQDATVSSIGDLKDSVVDQQPGALEDVSELATVDLSDGSAASRKQVRKGGGNAPGKAAPRRQGIITPQSNVSLGREVVPPRIRLRLARFSRLSHLQRQVCSPTSRSV